jgi:Uma2 family endonuclease
MSTISQLPPTPSEKKFFTVDDLMAMGDIGRCELISGELVMMAPAGGEHGEVALRLGSYLFLFVDEQQLGKTFGAETGFLLDPDLVRAPDASFVRAARLPSEVPSGFIEGPPDLAVEVISPSDAARYVREKVNTWLAKGTSTVWVVDPSTKTVAIHRIGLTTELDIEQSIENEPLLPGFVLPVRKVFGL